MSGLSSREPPWSIDELCEYVYGVNWVSSSIQSFAERIAPLHETLEKAYFKAGGSRKKKSMVKVLLADLKWGKYHFFSDLQGQLQEALTAGT